MKAGDRIKRVAQPCPWAPLGYETTALEMKDEDTRVLYSGTDGSKTHGYVEFWEVIEAEHLGAVSLDQTDVIIPTSRSIYLSGPMKGYPSSNYPLFNAVAEQLRRAGHRVYNPAEFGSDRPYDGFPIRQAFAAYSKFICEEADAIVLLPGWEASKGANAERALADNCGIEIIPFDRLSTTITTEGPF